MYYLCTYQARVHTRNVWENTRAHANQNAQVQFVQTKDPCAVHENHDAQGSRLTSRVYMHALNVYFYIIDLSCTHRLFCMYF